MRDDHPDTDLTDPHGEAEALRKENADLRATQEAGWALYVHWKGRYLDCAKERDALIARAEAAEAALAASRALPAAPVAAPLPVAHTGAFPDRIVLHANTDDFGVVGCAEDIWLDPVQDAAEITRLVKNQRAEIREYVPADSTTIGGAELDDLMEEATEWKLRAIYHNKKHGELIEILRAQPDWKAMAERLGEAMKPCLNFIENTESEFGIALECGNKARAALSDLAKMKGE